MSTVAKDEHASATARASTFSRVLALGSVSERVAHQALCSVLVVREAPWQRAEEREVAGE